MRDDATDADQEFSIGSQVAAYLSKTQGRKFDAADISIWDDLLGDYPPSLVMEALRTLIRDSDAFITPSRTRDAARAVASDRIDRAPNPTPPMNLGPDEYQTWLYTWRTQVVTGASPDEAGQKALASIGAPQAVRSHQPVTLPETKKPPEVGGIEPASQESTKTEVAERSTAAEKPPAGYREPFDLF